MGNPEEAAVTASGWHLSKRVGYVLAILAVATVTIVGLLTYYVGVMNACEAVKEPTTIQKPGKAKVFVRGQIKADGSLRYIDAIKVDGSQRYIDAR